MIGKNPYQQKEIKKPDGIIPGLTYSIMNTADQKLWEAIKKGGNSIDGLIHAVLNGQWDSVFGEYKNDSQLLNDIMSGKLNDDALTSIGNTMKEYGGVRQSGFIALNNHAFHVEPGSFTIKPKLNIAQTDMYMDGDDGKSYTYLQWLNTTGVVISMTIYNDVNEKYDGWTSGVAKDNETKNDNELYDASTKVNEVLLEWAETFNTVELWTSLGIPHIKGKYKITDIQQTMESQNIVKSEIELTSYTQDEFEKTYYKAYDISDLTDVDTSTDTAYAEKIKKIPTGLRKTCNCTGGHVKNG